MSGFDKVPTNPYQERAEAFRKQNEPGGINSPTQTTDQQTTPAQPAGVQPAPVQQPVNPPSAPVQPVATQPQNAGTYYDPALIQNLAYERDQLRQQLAADQQKMSDLQKSADELNDLRRRASIRADIQQQAIDNLESVSPEDYTAIVESATNLAMAQTEPLKKELEQQRKELEERTRYNQQMLENTRKDLLNARILLLILTLPRWSTLPSTETSWPSVTVSVLKPETPVPAGNTSTAILTTLLTS